MIKFVDGLTTSTIYKIANNFNNEEVIKFIEEKAIEDYHKYMDIFDELYPLGDYENDYLKIKDEDLKKRILNNVFNFDLYLESDNKTIIDLINEYTFNENDIKSLVNFLLEIRGYQFHLEYITS